MRSERDWQKRWEWTEPCMYRYVNKRQQAGVKPFCLINYRRQSQNMLWQKAGPMQSAGCNNSNATARSILARDAGFRSILMPAVYCSTCLLQLTSSNSSKICDRASEGWRGDAKERKKKNKRGSWAVGSAGTMLEDVVLHRFLSDSIKADGAPVKLPCAFYCYCSGPQSTQSDVQTWHIQAIASSVFFGILAFLSFA